MEKKVKIAKLTRQQKETNTILEILSEFYEPEGYKNCPETDTILFALGMVTWADNIWLFDLDFTFCTDKDDTVIAMLIIQAITEQKIHVEIGQGLQTFYKNDLYTSMIYQQDVYEIMIEQKVSEKEAEKIAKKTKLY